MLGLPDGIKAVLFDLDGVLTDTATVHFRAWKQMFEAHGWPFAQGDYDAYVDGKPREDGIRDFLSSRDVHPSESEITALGDEKNELVLNLIKTQGRQRLRRVAAVPDRHQGGGAAPRAGLLEQQRPAGPGGDRARQGHRGPRRRPRQDEAPACAASPRRTRSWRPRASSAWSRRRPPCSRTRWPGSRRARRATSGSSSASTASASATRCTQHGADIVVDDLSELL